MQPFRPVIKVAPSKAASSKSRHRRNPFIPRTVQVIYYLSVHD
jgi:hypothetical protein